MPVVKGGVWTNIEDEVLKAAVSKYGLNQWARVSSLLARKTPKQCKARWQEWLDPSIKKVEFTREEDEKLLHLAKLMPTQWRTIAPIVGRTANQCIERYQKLLDEAEQREASALGMTGADEASAAPSADDVRRLRPGEVDPDPETKPARPDTIDLDEDEKEMLSEARARLANTQGKKAKRKARERQQEESRRLAALQKRRELKTAGINIKVTTRKPGQMDYNADIPFEKKAAPGFYDTTDEMTLNERQRANFDPRKQQLAQAKRKQDEEDEAGRKRRKNDKDAPSASYREALKAGQMQRIREAEQSSKRKALALPAPQVGEGELEEIVKMGMIGERANSMAQNSDNDATRGLVNSYTTLNSGAPIRTPRAPAAEDHIANEIRNIRALTETQSSLLGGENTPLHEGAGSTGFESVAPRKQDIFTPNPMATPLRQGVNGPGATPLRPGQTPMRTPRDSFALNAQSNDLAVRQQLKRGLASLPKPKQQAWELELPEDEEEVLSASNGLPEDAADRDRRERELREAQALLERKRRTQVMQRNLPRPTSVDYAVLQRAAEELQDPAEKAIAKEAGLLILYDSLRFPLPAGNQPPNKTPPPRLEQIDDDLLSEARRQILVEAKGALAPAQVEAVWARSNTNSLLLGLGCYDDDEEEEQLTTLKAAYEDVQERMVASAERGAKVEKKLNLHLGGYKQRADTLRKKIGDSSAELEKATNALSAFRILAKSEEIAVQNRLGSLREEVAFISRREREAQELYRRNKEELDGIVADGVNGLHGD
ncbi:pre-mRNA splicing factor component-domain-containing protein [Coniella lustricola]|uniref:Pre-mRNA splicing factor component-domain-containing protein n=1 Tax=Coniella lustricola TaxID=2025994 RepID=A0A2T3AKV8_9PEZI|nr:pre-mRNA splicing factor component-domain-containing protein [Coniella lustricola]